MGLSSKQVSSDVQDWSQGLLKSTSDNSGSASSMESPKPPLKRQQQEQPPPPPEKLKCPRCDSSNTKFCYYNNYNKSQPRHYCKACKRHWTKGGMLRNVPVGGGRKNKRLKTSSNSSKTATRANISVQASDQRLSSRPIRLENENSKKKKTLNQADLGPQSFIQHGLFNNAMDFCIGRNSSHESSLNGMFGGSSALSIPQNHDLQFPCPSFSTLDENYPCSISGSCHISNPYGLESNALESVVTSLDQTSFSCSSMNDKPWLSNESTSNWVWDDIDKFVTSDVTISWDDAEIN